MASKCALFRSAFGSRADRWPFQRAGFSPDRRPLTFAASSTRSTRDRIRVAVSALVDQIGFSASSTISVSTDATSAFQITAACCVRDASHWSRCFGDFQLGSSVCIRSLATAENSRGRRRDQRGLADFDRVEAVFQNLARVLGRSACLCQADVSRGAQPHLPALASKMINPDPAAGQGLVDAEIQPGAIGV